MSVARRSTTWVSLGECIWLPVVSFLVLVPPDQTLVLKFLKGSSLHSGKSPGSLSPLYSADLGLKDRLKHTLRHLCSHCRSLVVAVRVVFAMYKITTSKQFPNQFPICCVLVWDNVDCFHPLKMVYFRNHLLFNAHQD